MNMELEKPEFVCCDNCRYYNDVCSPECLRKNYRDFQPIQHSPRIDAGGKEPTFAQHAEKVIPFMLYSGDIYTRFKKALKLAYEAGLEYDNKSGLGENGWFERWFEENKDKL